MVFDFKFSLRRPILPYTSTRRPNTRGWPIPATDATTWLARRPTWRTTLKTFTRRCATPAPSATTRPARSPISSDTPRSSMKAWKESKLIQRLWMTCRTSHIHRTPRGRGSGDGATWTKLKARTLLSVIIVGIRGQGPRSISIPKPSMKVRVRRFHFQNS